MFGFISKKKFVKEIIKIYENNATERAFGERDLYYRMGNANALNALCVKFNVDLTAILRKRKNDCGAYMTWNN